MTTALSKPIARKTATPHRGRQLIVTLYPGDVIGVRQLRTRKEYTVPLSWVYDMGVKAEVNRQRAERAKKRTTRVTRKGRA
jgi:hypothetical protein